MKVEQGRAVGILANSPGIATAPYSSSATSGNGLGLSEGRCTETRRRDERQIGGTSALVDTDEIVQRVIAAMKHEDNRLLTRSTGSPTFAPVGPREDDIMSFIHDEQSSGAYHNSHVAETVPENPYPRNSSSMLARPTYSPPTEAIPASSRKSGEEAGVTFAAPSRTRSGPALPSSPRPMEPIVHHQRNDTILTNDTLLGYYTSSIPSYSNWPGSSYRSQLSRNVTAMTVAEEEETSEWSGYNTAEEAENLWEDKGAVGRSTDYRRVAAERLAQYRKER